LVPVIVAVVVKAADVVVVVVSEDLRSAHLAHPHNNTSSRPAEPCSEPSFGPVLLCSLRTSVVLRPTSAKRLAVRFDYTPAVTDVDRDLAIGLLPTISADVFFFNLLSRKHFIYTQTIVS